MDDATVRPTPGGEPIATLVRGDGFNPSGRREGVWSYGQTPDGRHLGWVGTTYLCRV